MKRPSLQEQAEAHTAALRASLMHAIGKTYAQIGAELGVSEGTARELVCVGENTRIKLEANL